MLLQGEGVWKVFVTREFHICYKRMEGGCHNRVSYLLPNEESRIFVLSHVTRKGGRNVFDMRFHICYKERRENIYCKGDPPLLQGVENGKCWS